MRDPVSGREETVTKAGPAGGVVGEARFELARLATPAPKAGASAVPPLARGFVRVKRVLLDDGRPIRRTILLPSLAVRGGPHPLIRVSGGRGNRQRAGDPGPNTLAKRRLSGLAR